VKEQLGNYKWLLSMIGFMLILTLLSIVSGGSFSSVNVDQTYIVNVNGTTSEYFISEAGFSIDAYSGAITWLVIIAAIGVAAGIGILGSGLSETSVNLLYKSIFYGVVWGILSIFPAGLIFQIELFGPIIYITLTIVYVIVVIMVI